MEFIQVHIGLNNINIILNKYNLLYVQLIDNSAILNLDTMFT